MNVLSQLIDVKGKRAIICQMIRGFASNFDLKLRSQIVGHILQLTGEAPISDLGSAPLDFYIKENDHGAKFSFYPPKFQLSDFTDVEEPPILHTVGT